MCKRCAPRRPRLFLLPPFLPVVHLRVLIGEEDVRHHEVVLLAIRGVGAQDDLLRAVLPAVHLVREPREGGSGGEGKEGGRDRQIRVFVR